MLSAGFNENLMSLFFCESNNLVLYTRTITRTLTVNFTAVKRGAVQIFKYNTLGFKVGIGYIAWKLVLNISLVIK